MPPPHIGKEGRPALLAAFAEERLQAWREQRLERRAASDITDLSLDEAYQVQSLFLQARERTGERIVGWKIGCTSPAIQEQFGLTQPICGRLLEPHILHDGDTLRSEDYVECAVEAEMAMLIGRDLEPGMDVAEVRNSIAAVSPAIELHNYHFWYGRPTSQELIASNGIHAGLVLGRRHSLAGHDLDDELMQVFVNGSMEAHGAGRDVMGGPMRSLQWLARHVAASGERVRAGDLVIPGSAVRLVGVAAGDSIEARFSSLGSCCARLL